MSVVNLYTLPNCPKCKILKDICSKSKFIKNSDFEVCDATNPSYAEYLNEKGVKEVPVLLVDDTLYSFNEAMSFLRKEG